MKKYKPEELVLLIDRTQYCFYALLKATEEYKKMNKNISDQELRNLPVVSLPFHFYREVFIHRLSEIYTFFYLADDQELLSKLSMPDENRKLLRELRHSLAHFPDFEEFISRNKKLLEASNISDTAKDIKVIVKYSCSLMVNEAHEYREKLKKEFLFIIGLFPGLFSEEFKNEMTDF